VVSAVERRRDEDALDDRLEPSGQIEVPVLEQVGRAEDELEHEHALRRYTEEDDGGEPHGKGEQQLAGMETEGRRDVKARVPVVHLVEAPEERQPMIGPVPRVGDGVESQQADGYCPPSAHACPGQ
jgi:hypothetical protein